MTDYDLHILSSSVEGDVGKALLAYLTDETKRVSGMIRIAKIDCEVYQNDIRFALGYADAIQRLKQIIIGSNKNAE